MKRRVRSYRGWRRLVVAAIAAKREGRSVIWVNPAGFPGGMSASGLGATDFLGKRNTFGGIASEFYDGVAGRRTSPCKGETLPSRSRPWRLARR